MILLDTHIWVWWVSGVEKLPRKIISLIDKAINERAVYISSISAWEVAQLVKRKRLELSMNVEAWISKTESMPFVKFIPVDNYIAVKSVNLPGTLHTDPADRIIIATAINFGLPLATTDSKIINYRNVRTV